MVNDKQLVKQQWVIIGSISLIVSILHALLILNWFFEITTFQKFQGAPIFFGTFISPIGFFLGFSSYVKTQSKIALLAIISNGVLFILPFLYFFLGTLIFGP